MEKLKNFGRNNIVSEGSEMTEISNLVAAAVLPASFLHTSHQISQSPACLKILAMFLATGLHMAA
jgi:hypothetical protein